MSAMSSLRRQLSNYREKRSAWRQKMRGLRSARKAHDRELNKLLFDPKLSMRYKRTLINGL